MEKSAYGKDSWYELGKLVMWGITMLLLAGLWFISAQPMIAFESQGMDYILINKSAFWPLTILPLIMTVLMVLMFFSRPNEVVRK